MLPLVLLPGAAESALELNSLTARPQFCRLGVRPSARARGQTGDMELVMRGGVVVRRMIAAAIVSVLFATLGCGFEGLSPVVHFVVPGAAGAQLALCWHTYTQFGLLSPGQVAYWGVGAAGPMLLALQKGVSVQLLLILLMLIVALGIIAFLLVHKREKLPLTAMIGIILAATGVAGYAVYRMWPGT